MDLFAIPRDVRDIIWAKSREMLRDERERIKTYFIDEVLEKLYETELPSESEEVAIEGSHITNGISLGRR